ncbi:hypothetical protein C8258_30170 [Nocardia sp. MDA0666]|uniref:hypothetical protein n=1 Tax=Nocardia sp. MDA0666 TaxID=2135448 RepID=UPI000D115BDD|nr:hypothetical protein [Nocardia sp. MDA0666]PSR59184.1 hypothetical protein C8258_30170 [Nocardia sp. MDA0666]
MNWAEKMERIAGTYADSVRQIRYRIEEVDDVARENNAALGVIDSRCQGDGDLSKEPPKRRR